MTKYEASSRSFAMAMYGMAVCALLAALPTQAITIDARLMSFQSTDADLNSGGPAGGIGTFELLNIGRTGAPATRSVFLGQDFAVYRNVEIPAPMPIALMGLGLLGIRRVVRDVQLVR